MASSWWQRVGGKLIPMELGSPSIQGSSGSCRSHGSQPNPTLAVATSTPSLPTVETTPLFSYTSHSGGTCSGPAGWPADTQHAGVAKKLLKKYQDVVGASTRLPTVKQAVEHRDHHCQAGVLPLQRVGSRETDHRQGGVCDHGVPRDHQEV